MHRVLLALFVCLAATPVSAQALRQVTVDYSYLRAGGTNLSGAAVNGAVTFVGVDAWGSGEWAALGVDVSASRETGSRRVVRGDQPFDLDEQRTSLLGGFRLAGPWLKFATHVRILAGASNRSITERDAAGLRRTRSLTTPVLGVGAGIELPVGRHVYLRAVEIDGLLFPADGTARTGFTVRSGVGIWW